MSKIYFTTPQNKEEFKEYDLFRWRILREPIGKSVESLKDDYEEHAYHLIGILNHKIIACGRLHKNSSTEAQIRYMAVDKKIRSKGIGKKIIDHLEDYAKKNHFKTVVLNARDHAIKFYQNSGYEIVGPYNGSDTGIPHSKMIKKF
tara:strand:+ start:4524 stop:4961 length:438 start_codon:yes stop_codon:yes gene_type:complete